MDAAKAPYFAALRAQLDHLSARQRLTSENIANAATPGFTPRDSDQASFTDRFNAILRKSGAGGAELARTQPGHMGPSGETGAAPAVKVIAAPDSETTLDGNSVVLEEQMMRATETRMAYETSLALYQKGLQLMRMAVKSPSR